MSGVKRNSREESSQLTYSSIKDPTPSIPSRQGSAYKTEKSNKTSKTTEKTNKTQKNTEKDYIHVSTVQGSSHSSTRSLRPSATLKPPAAQNYSTSLLSPDMIMSKV